MIYKLFFITCFFLNITTSLSQSVDELVFTSKLHLIQELSWSEFPIDSSKFKKQLSLIEKFNYNFLEVIECDLPFGIEMKFISIRMNETESKFTNDNKVPGICDYVVGILILDDSYTFYRLKGFRLNDFLLLLDDIEYYEKGFKKTIKKDLSISDYIEVDGLDLNCLLKASMNTNDFFDCMISCISRDDNFFGTKKSKNTWLAKFSNSLFLTP